MTIIKNQKISAGQDGEQLEALHIAGRNVEWYSCYEIQFGGSSKMVKLSYEPAILILGIDSEK